MGDFDMNAYRVAIQDRQHRLREDAELDWNQWLAAGRIRWRRFFARVGLALRSLHFPQRAFGAARGDQPQPQANAN